MTGNNQVLDSTYYQLYNMAYYNDKKLKDRVYIKDSSNNVMQEWGVNETFHDKQTGMDAVAFERDVDGKKQVMVAFRGTEGDKIIEKNSLGISMKPRKV
ncbi:hypothetical protein BK727_15905 [Bacillus thuringiensis serovar roskildiensis]|uniref:Uncharacterized protein n=1 Tax=Bacillus thuringiensis serovar sooncheon TaxID=180891 RepID=A0A9Q5SGL9_BACTU|nr:hypothetical protein BK707_21205 [Bacillus thuringiensis serovar coreanensis]OTX44298.1 hypothetical protein BK724_16500 [Bacillus thuringiensis serovar sooncheon]OTX53461.1 hypothetical protein BK725_14885 [Bacillus thuringiensis serovar guiyangiensis]OTX67782.1 hypothetical protein BK727_15905 [Bacillus thuringiensis serovar roskildiensis]